MTGTTRRHDGPTGRLRRFFCTREGASSLEFAILAPVFFGIVFAIIETFVAYAAEQVLLNANDSMARRIRMGEITFEMDRPTDVDAREFRTLFCEELVVLLSCDESTDEPSRLHIDVRSLANFGEAADVMECPDADTFAPGGKQSTNIVRACYRWPIIVDYLRMVSRLYGPSGETIDGQNLVATAVFRNEDYQ